MNVPRSSIAVFRSRIRLRASAALTASLLVLTGAGEVLGACHCAHRGGGHGDGEPPIEVSDTGGHGAHVPQGTRDAGAGAHADHHGATPAEGVDVPADAAGHDPADAACRALCALACATAQPPATDGIQRVPPGATGAGARGAPPTERTDHVADASRPHVLPPSQGPPFRG